METIYLKVVVERDIPRLDAVIARRIYTAIENKIKTKPFLYGLALRGTLHKFWKLRVGDYRIVYTALNRKILIVGIGHRKEVYDMIIGRL